MEPCYESGFDCTVLDPDPIWTRTSWMVPISENKHIEDLEPISIIVSITVSNSNAFT